MSIFKNYREYYKNNPEGYWFKRKLYGWGWIPVKWQGWVVIFIWLLFFTFIILKLEYHWLARLIFIILSLAVLILICYKKGEKQVWEWRPMPKGMIVFIIILFLLIFLPTVYWAHKLKVAHSSFENYYNFRGCVQLIEKTDTYGICKLSSGETIKLVKINNNWYLDGDGPGVF